MKASDFHLYSVVESLGFFSLLIVINPAPLTPEIMFGSTSEKRNELYEEITGALQKQILPMKSKVEEFKKLPKKDREKLLSRMTPIAKKCNVLEKRINALKEAEKNPWIPVPVHHIETTYEEVNNTNSSIKPNVLVLEYVPDNKMAKKEYYVLLYELIGESDKVTGEIPGYKNGKIEIPYPKSTKEIFKCT